MTDNLEIHKVKERIKMNNTKQTQDDRTIQPFNCSIIQRVKAYAFTLAETLIVIGIIGVVAALTLPNLNHATGDKETVTRVMKAYSMLNEANDRAVATYGPISEWASDAQCAKVPNSCYMKRLKEFLKVSKSCDETGDEEDSSYLSCENMAKGDMGCPIIHQLADGISIGAYQGDFDCNDSYGPNDVCFDEIVVDINGPNKGKNTTGQDIFYFQVSDSIGIIPYDAPLSRCVEDKDYYCTNWIVQYGNLDYLKADEEGKCNDNPSIILDGVNNTSCH